MNKTISNITVLISVDSETYVQSGDWEFKFLLLSGIF